MFSNQNSAKLCNIFSCEVCDYSTQRKSSYDSHLLSAKHKKSINGNQNSANSAKTCNSVICELCQKTYKDNSGLWRHKKKCIIDVNSGEKQQPTDKELILLLIKENTDFKNMMMKVLENGTNSHNTNSHNKSFNLNETCKNAMNISDFVDSLKLQLSDLIQVGELGYIEGITNIIVKNLNALDVTQRPIHCMDKKRETMYIKDENQWEKDDLRRAKMHTLVRKVANKNISLIQKYREKYPDCIKSTSRFSDQYNKIVIESMGCSGETNEYEKEERIIRKVAREVFVDKECDSL